MGSLRDRAEKRAKLGGADRTRIGQCMAEHPDQADEIRDLLLGEPLLGHQVVADTLNEVFDLGVNGGDVGYWRRRYG